jgi:hypothetical protein
MTGPSGRYEPSRDSAVSPDLRAFIDRVVVPALFAEVR